MNAGLSYITLGVSDLQRQLNFYRDGFGFTLKRHYQGTDNADRDFAFFDLGPLTLALYPQQALANDAGITEHGRGFCGVALSYNVSSADAVDQLIGHLQRHGASLSRAPDQQSWGGYSGYLLDPENNLWEIVWSPSRHPQDGD